MDNTAINNNELQMYGGHMRGAPNEWYNDLKDTSGFKSILFESRCDTAGIKYEKKQANMLFLTMTGKRMTIA